MNKNAPSQSYKAEPVLEKVLKSIDIGLQSKIVLETLQCQGTLCTQSRIHSGLQEEVCIIIEMGYNVDSEDENWPFYIRFSCCNNQNIGRSGSHVILHSLYWLKLSYTIKMQK